MNGCDRTRFLACVRTWVGMQRRGQMMEAAPHTASQDVCYEKDPRTQCQVANGVRVFCVLCDGDGVVGR